MSRSIWLSTPFRLCPAAGGLTSDSVRFPPDWRPGGVTRSTAGPRFSDRLLIWADLSEGIWNATLAPRFQKSRARTTCELEVSEQVLAGFSGKHEHHEAAREAEIKELRAKVGELVIERDFLSKAFGR